MRVALGEGTGRSQAEEPARDVLLARAADLIQSEPNFARFLRLTIEATSSGDLAYSDPVEVEGLLRRSYGEIDRPRGGPYRLVLSPDVLADGGEAIDIYSIDMPFIVDSALAALRSKGVSPRLIAHPVLALDGQSRRLLDRPSADADVLSVVHLQLPPLDGATREAARQELAATLDAVSAATSAWRPMLARLARAAENLSNDGPLDGDAAEAVRFLGWLADQNLTFLGMREYRLSVDGELEPGDGLGILADPAVKFLRQGGTFVEMTDQHRAFLADAAPMLVTKSNLRSRVHRRAHMDYVGVKIYAGGEVIGELRILGLFTSGALAASPLDTPWLKPKLEAVIERADLDGDAHARKALQHAIETYPREELFQIEPRQLADFASVVAGLADRPRVRLLVRPDPFGNFLSILLFMPRERYDSAVRARIGARLAEVFEGRVSAWYPYFPEADLVRVHFIIGRDGGVVPSPNLGGLEAEITGYTLSFAERLALTAEDPALVAGYEEAFGAGYRAEHTPEQAITDIALCRRIDDEAGRAVRFVTASGGRLAVTMASRFGPVPLSDRVPLLENFGFRVIDERTYPLRPVGPPVFLHEMAVEFADASGIDIEARAEGLERGLLSVWQGEADNDRFGALILVAGLDWRDVGMLRGLCRYLRQLGFSYTLDYLADTLRRHPDAAAALVALFRMQHDPKPRDDRGERVAAARRALDMALERTAALDEDRIIRRLANLIDAAVRTNFFQTAADGSRRPTLAIKFDSHAIEDMPLPRPFREIFVTGPTVEGIHLRAGAVARGGLRWSDRPEDFRAEALALMKTQQVKNAIIVPAGAKGAFVPRRRSTIAGQSFGAAAYRSFVTALLEVTDTLEGSEVVPPAQTVRRDGDDPYLVVAADKGTSSFSDLGNQVASEHGFWLGDAFASGGSQGYDHKALGITARGAFETIRRHFAELGRNVDAEPISVVGVGDMSGDVFGNFMLLSPNLQLVGAFDHRDIFLDPLPEPNRAFDERRRLFELPRSSWQDYDRTRLSRGGDVFSRTQKTVTVSNEARRWLGLPNHTLTPPELIVALLRSEVDLLYFAGIGTFVRAGTETDLEVGDKANDAIRVAASALRAKVIGEGANLAMTQRARSEYALGGGRINTDAIDNSAGVNCSDLEVNIKIALGPLLAAGEIDGVRRSVLLERMQPEVVALCLRNNQLQALALSLAEAGGNGDFADHMAVLKSLDESGELDRKVEALPDDDALAGRLKAGKALTRPELAVLMAYAKNRLRAALSASPRMVDDYFVRDLRAYFPARLSDELPDAVTGHQLRQNIIATSLANQMINRGGIAFADRLVRASSADSGALAVAFVLARDGFRIDELNRLVELQDKHLSGATQVALYRRVERLVQRGTLWMVRNVAIDRPVGELVQHYSDGLAEVRNLLPTLVTGSLAKASIDRAAALEAIGAPRDLARRIAELPDLALGADVVLLADRASARIADAARALFGLGDLFGLTELLDLADSDSADALERLALDRAGANLRRALRDLGHDVLASGDGPAQERLARWKKANAEALAQTQHAVAELTRGGVSLARLSLAAGLLSDLARSA